MCGFCASTTKAFLCFLRNDIYHVLYHVCLLASSMPFATSRLSYPIALHPEHASVCMDAGNPNCPRARRNPEISFGEELWGPGGMYCGLIKRLAYSPLAFGPIRTPQLLWIFFWRANLAERRFLYQEVRYHVGGKFVPHHFSTTTIWTNPPAPLHSHIMPSIPDPLPTGASTPFPDPNRAEAWY